MDYEKLHKYTIYKLQQMVNSGKITVEIARGICADFVPESEDERIRKELLDYCKNRAEYYPNDPKYKNISAWIAWLEKQGMPAKYHDICDTCVRQPTCQSDCFLQQDEQKNDWSEEDVAMLDSAIAFVEHSAFTTIGKGKNNVIAWLKSLKDRVQPQPKQELSEEDIEMIDYVASILYSNFNENDKFDDNKPCVGALVDRLKSLRPQSRWNPSEGQLEALKKACDEHWEPDGLDPLYTLYQDLKKLREE